MNFVFLPYRIELAVQSKRVSVVSDTEKLAKPISTVSARRACMCVRACVRVALLNIGH
jgi:hypothetical protein